MFPRHIKPGQLLWAKPSDVNPGTTWLILSVEYRNLSYILDEVKITFIYHDKCDVLKTHDYDIEWLIPI